VTTAILFVATALGSSRAAADSTAVAGVDADLLAAAEAGRVDRLGPLLAQGAHLEARDSIGRTPLMLAVIERRTDAVRALLDHGADLHAVNRFGGSVLWFGLVRNNPEVVGMLVERGAGLTVDGAPAIILPAGRGDTATARVLLERGASVNDTSSTGWTPLMAAVSNRQRVMVDFLIARGANVNAVDRGGRTALSLALVGPFGSDGRIVKALKKAGAK